MQVVDPMMELEASIARAEGSRFQTCKPDQGCSWRLSLVGIRLTSCTIQEIKARENGDGMFFTLHLVAKASNKQKVDQGGVAQCHSDSRTCPNHKHVSTCKSIRGRCRVKIELTKFQTA